MRGGAEIVAQAGDHVASPSSQRLQAGARHLLRALLLVFGNELGLPGDFVKFRLGRSRAKGADANAVRLQFLGEPFRTVARTVVELTDGFEVIGEVESAEESVSSARDLHPDSC